MCNIYGKKKHAVQIKTLKMASDCGLILGKDNCVNEFNLKAWLKPYINMGVKLKAKPKNDFTKDFFKLMNNPVFGKTTENVKNHRDINLVTTNKRRNKLLSEPNYHTTNHFSKILLSIKMNETNKKNKPVYLSLSILDMSKRVM